MSFLSQFFSGGGKNTDIGSYGVGLATGFSNQIPVDLMLIGGGGGGGSVKNTSYGPTFSDIPTMMLDSYQGGGGGVGRVLVYNNCIVNTGVAYPITVGAGGAANQRGGTSIFGILRSGGGGRGAGTNPDGTPQTPDVQDFWGGSQGGYGISHLPITPPFIATPAYFFLYQARGNIIPTSINTQGTTGKLSFSDQPISASLVNNTVLPTTPQTDSYLTNASNIFKQSINSVVLNSPTIFQPFTAWPNISISIGDGQGGTGASLPHFVKQPNLGSTTQGIINCSAYNNTYRSTALPLTQVQDNYLSFPGNPLSSSYPRNPLQNTKDFIADFFDRAGINSPITDGVGGAGGGGVRFIPGPSFPNGLYGPVSFDRVVPYIDYRDSPSFTFPSVPNQFIPKEHVFSRPTFISSPIWNSVTSADGQFSMRIPSGGGPYINPGPFFGSPVAGLPFATQTDKLLSWSDPSGFDFALAGGSPGNGGGGGGGIRVGPVTLQGTVTIPRFNPLFGAQPTTIVPYALNIAGSPLSYASGGAGGSGSVWVIYPTDYAAATVVGNTPVPSPPAFRIYRWDGAGSITFNAS